MSFPVIIDLSSEEEIIPSKPQTKLLESISEPTSNARNSVLALTIQVSWEQLHQKLIAKEPYSRDLTLELEERRKEREKKYSKKYDLNSADERYLYS